MQIKLKTTMCGPNGNFSAGQIISAPGNISIETAGILVDSAHAELILEKKPLSGKIETASIAPKENAMQAKGKAKKS